MKSISLVPGTTNLSLTEVEEPTIENADELKVKVLEVGICGTDREQAAGGRADAPEGKQHLIIGHEMFGQVVEVGTDVLSVGVGDYAVFTVRRGCGNCVACNNNRSDMCYTGNYKERGIKGADGFQAQYVVDKEKFMVKVPDQIKEIGVLTEPMSVAAKAIDEAICLQAARLGSFHRTENLFAGQRALVAGIGAIGLMAAFALRLRGAEVIGMDIVDEGTLRPQILKQIGGRYIDGREITATEIDEKCGEFDLVFEATGIAKLQIELIDSLAVNGIFIATGIPAGERPVSLAAGSIMQQLVLKNQIILGSVNAGIDHYRMAVADLVACYDRWPEQIKQVITGRIPYTHFKEAIHEHSIHEIKVVVDWKDN